MPWPLCYDPGGYGWNRTTMTEGRPVDVALLRRFSPLDGMKNENLMALTRKVAISPLAANRILFRDGDAARRTIWLVSGLLELREGERTLAMIKGGSPEASVPLPTKLPRRVTARAVDPIEYVAIDS